MSIKKIKVTKESDSGRNEQFKDLRTGREMSRAQFVRAIEAGDCPNHHVRIIRGVKTPVSNPDTSSSNNLG